MNRMFDSSFQKWSPGRRVKCASRNNEIEWLYRFSGRLFRVTAEQFDAVNFAGIVYYKVGIFLLNLVPFLALTFVRGD